MPTYSAMPTHLHPPVVRKASCLRCPALGAMVLAVMLSSFGSSSTAREFRTLNEIHTAALLPDGAAAVEHFIPVDQGLVNDAVNQIMQQWSTPQMQAYLSKDFYDASRLEDVLDTVVPRDALVRILTVGGIQTLQQFQERDAATGKAVRVSRVSVTVRTQLEYNDPATGLVTLPGTTEYILKFRELLPGGDG
ncbi:MAG: hypothetical protein R3E54_09735 [Halioglobus sp.]